MATWRKLIDEERTKRGDGPLVAVAPPDLDLNREFYDSFGTSCGEPFTAWTEERVYFPIVYDGAEWVGSAPRNPCDEASEHHGGQ